MINNGISILTPITPNRINVYQNLINNLEEQRRRLKLPKEFLDQQIELDNFEKSIGEKRNNLLERAKNKYSIFIDSDDNVSNNFLQDIIQVIDSEPDTITFKSLQTDNNQIYNFSLQHKEFKRSDVVKNGKREMFWPVGHISLIKTEIAKQIKFQHCNYREDIMQSEELLKSGLLKTEIHFNEIMYYYNFNSGLSDAQKNKFKF